MPRPPRLQRPRRRSAAQILPGPIVARIVGFMVGACVLFSLKRFYKQGWAMTAAKFVEGSFLYGVVCLAPAVAATVTTGLLVG